MHTAAPEAPRAEAPVFKPEPCFSYERYSSSLFRPDPFPSLYVIARRDVTVSAVINGMCGRFEIAPSIARALAAELIAAADAAEQQREAA